MTQPLFVLAEFFIFIAVVGTAIWQLNIYDRTGRGANLAIGLLNVVVASFVFGAMVFIALLPPF